MLATVVLLCTACILIAATPAFGAVVDQELVSVATGGSLANAASDRPDTSADGRFVVFTSTATNLVPGDTNGSQDIFVRDRLTGTTSRVSVASDGSQANSASFDPSISANGRYVAFTSNASNLVPSDTNAAQDVFVFDRGTGFVKRVSTAWDGSQSNGGSFSPSISADGRYVAFASAATNLLPGDTNAADDIFVRDTATNTVKIASTATGGLTAGNSGSMTPSISDDGRFVVFSSSASNLVPADTNAAMDVFMRDLVLGVTSRVSVSSSGLQGDIDSSQWAQISGNGRYVAFGSSATNLVSGDTNAVEDDFVHDNTTGATTRVSVSTAGAQGNDNSWPMLAISPDGRYVAFTSSASSLVAADTNGTYDAFIHDNASGTTERVSVSAAGAQANQVSYNPVGVSMDGRYVTFISAATNLVGGDTNASIDIFTAQLRPAASEIARTPSASSVTFRRKKGKVAFTLAAAATGDFKRPIPGAIVFLQSSSNGKSWTTRYTLTTDAAGKVSHRYTAKRASKTYYRWVLVSTPKWAPVTTSKQKVTVK